MDPGNPRHLISLDGIRAAPSYTSTYGGSVSIQDYIQRVQELNATNLLQQISFWNRKLENADRRGSDRLEITRESLAHLAKVALLEGMPEGGRNANPKEFKDLCMMYTDLSSECAIPTEGESQEETTKRFASYFLRSIQANELHKRQGTAPPRALMLFDQLPKEMSLEFDIPGEFKKITGLTTFEWVACGMFLLGFYKEEHIYCFDLEEVLEKTPHLKLGVTQFLDRASLDIAAFREKFKGQSDQVFGLNPLSRYPLVRSGKVIACPIRLLLMEKMSGGIYHQILTALAGTARAEAFTNALGMAFQEYVGRAIRPYEGRQHILPESAYGADGSQRTPDWIVLNGKKAVIIECKSKRLRQAETKSAGDLDSLRADLEKGVVKGLIQTQKFLRNLRDKAKGLETFPIIREAHVLIALPEDYYLANTVFFRREIDALYRKQHGDEPPPYSIIDIDELECMATMGASDRRGMYGIVEHWRLDEEFTYDSFTNYMWGIEVGDRATHAPLATAFNNILARVRTFLSGSTLLP